MHTFSRLLIVSVVLVLLAPARPAASLSQSPAPATDAGTAVVPGQVLLAFSDSARGRQALLAAGIIPAADPRPRIAVARVPAGRERELAQRWSTLPGVRWAEPNYIVRGQAEPGDPLWPDQWWQHTIGTAAAWDITLGDPETIIAVADTGIDLDHPDRPRLWLHAAEVPGNKVDDDGNGKVDDVHGWHWYTMASGSYGDDDIQIPTEDERFPNPKGFHGMHISGIVAAPAGNGAGVAGVAQGPALMILRVLNENALGSILDVADAIYYAVDEGATLINLSLGTATYSQALAEAVDYAAARGVLLVAAAGNDGGEPLYPAALPEVIAVGGSDAADQLYARSNRGEALDLVAPATDILSTWASSFRGGYHTLTGTSMSSAEVSGALALLRSLRPSDEAADLRQWLYASAVDLGPAGWDESFGWGRLQVDEALRQAAQGLSLALQTEPAGAAAGEPVQLAARIMSGESLAPLSGLPVSFDVGEETPLLAASVRGEAVVWTQVPLTAQVGEDWLLQASWHGQDATTSVRILAPPTATPSPTPTPTFTATPSPTATQTATVNPTSTDTATPSPSPTATATPPRAYLPLIRH